MKTFQQISVATLLTLSLTTVTIAGTISGGSSRVGTITGSRVGTITGSRTGTITGSSTGTITGSTVGIIPTQGQQGSRFRIQDELISGIWLLLTNLSW